MLRSLWSHEVKGYSDENVKGDQKKENILDGEADTRASQKTVKDLDSGTTVGIIGLCVYSQGLEVLDGLLGKKISVFPS